MKFLKKHKSNIVFVFFSCVILILFLVSFLFPINLEKEETNEKEDIKIVEEKKEIILVDIKGEVNNPGVYEMESGKRVIDVISKAGELTKNADTSNINLSQKVTDEMVIVVNSKKDILNKEKEVIKNNASINENDSKIVTKDGNLKVNINSATKETLMTLSGIGESKAENIIAYRDENGLFEKIEDLMLVSGIGESVFEKIKNNITI